GLEDVGAVGQERTRLPKVAAAEIFEYDRQIVGQLARRQLVTGPLVEAFEIDHGLSAIARLPVQVLEEMERSRTAAIEEVDIALLGLQEIARSETVDPREQTCALARRDERGGADCIGNFRQCLPYLVPRVRQQRTECPQHDHRRPPHVSSDLIGVSVRRPILPPNSDECGGPKSQPLPKVKPQEPRKPQASPARSR